MEFHLSLPQLPILLSFIVSFTVFIVSLLKSDRYYAVFLLLLMLAIFEWSGAYLLEISARAFPLIVFFSKLKYFGIAFAPVFFLLFTMSFTGTMPKQRLLRLLPLLLIIPALNQFVVWIEPLHHFFFSDVRIIPVENMVFIQHDYGPVFWFHTIYSYGLLLTGAFILIRMLVSGEEKMTGSVVLLIVALFVPLLGNVLHLFRLTGPMQFIDLTPVSFSFSGALFLYVILRYRVVDFVPITHQLILDNLREVILVLDHENRIIEVNPAASYLFRQNQEDILGHPILDLSLSNREIISGFKDIYDIECETELYIRGEQRSFELSIVPIQDRRLPSLGRVVVLRDITERKIAELQATRSERMESLELLAGGVSHDFNNLLSAIVGNLSLAVLENRDPLIAEYLKQIESALDQARDLTRQLNNLSRKSCPEAEAVSLKSMVEQAAGIFLGDSQIEARMEMTDDLWNIFVDPAQITQVVNNLLVNALQAMPEGGRIIVKAENIRLSSGNKLSLNPGTYVHACFTDTGPGIPVDKLPHIFDPYYTTKKDGSGLGLAMAQAIVLNNQGAIFAESGPGGCFHLYLPAFTEPGHDQQVPPSAGSSRRSDA
ncbi:histidine kinase N-terminal 7TM domain-containing protein [Marispirochaeta aestuarii]|uniref:histidine kinase N-terminal 7TM domain-containing protein n=1 Tax=Marispirochaeta aestuarii TaxID=1963862 RepID=UPI0029C99CCC|nr:histidine kinase N-terminal 7TM domain-containing protein [Marispirochaeta aestuarii]